MEFGKKKKKKKAETTVIIFNEISIVFARWKWESLKERFLSTHFLVIFVTW